MSWRYRFGAFEYDPDCRALIGRRDVQTLRPQTAQVLEHFLEKPERLVTRDELNEAVWKDVSVGHDSLAQCIRELRRALRDDARKPRYIATVPKEGFRFLEPVTVELPAPPSGTDRKHFLVAGALYGSLYSVALALETAYDYSSYSDLVRIGAPCLFLWIFFTSQWAFRLVGRGRAGFGLGVFLGAGLATHLVMQLCLPDQPITQASIQTHSAEVSFLKNVVYFLIVAVTFLVLPLSLVSEFRRELLGGKKGSHWLTASRRGPLQWAVLTFLPAWFLFCLAASYIGMSHLLDHLEAGPYMSWFQQLLWWRWGLFVFLGIEAMTWYFSAILRRQPVFRQPPNDNGRRRLT